MCVKRKALLSFTISIQLVITAMLYHAATPFIIQEGRSKGVSPGLCGLIISVASVPSLLLGFWTGPLAVKFGRRRLLIYSILLECTFNTLFGLLQYVQSPTVFVCLGLSLRIILGAHVFLHKTLGYMLASKHLYDHYKKMSVFLMMGINVGMIIAVFFGNFLYQLTSQNMLTPILIFVGVDLFIYLPLAIWVIPKDDEASKIPFRSISPQPEKAKSSHSIITSDALKIIPKGHHYPISRALCTRKALVLFSSIAVLMLGELFYVSYLNTQIENNYEVGDVVVSFIHTFRSAGILFSSSITSLFPKRVNEKIIIFVCFIIQALSMAMIGPSKVLGIPQYLQITAAGTLVKGLADGFCYAYILPEIIEILRQKDGESYSVEHIGDTAAGLQGLMVEVGFLVSFFVGPLLCAGIGFQETADVHLGLFIVQILLLVFCGGILSRRGKVPKTGVAEV